MFAAEFRDYYSAFLRRHTSLSQRIKQIHAQKNARGDRLTDFELTSLKSIYNSLCHNEGLFLVASAENEPN